MTVIQANTNVIQRQRSECSTFDFWLKVSTLERGKPILLPVKLARYHKQALEGRDINSSVVLARQGGRWWLTLSSDEQVKVETPKDAPVIGVDVGIANFLTTSDGKHYGTFHGKLAKRHKWDRAKRRRKTKLRACLKRKGVKHLPSTRSRKLARQVRKADQSRGQRGLHCLSRPSGCLRAAEPGGDEVCGAGDECLSLRLQPWAHPQAACLGCKTGCEACHTSEKCVQFARVFALSLYRSRKPAKPADVLLCGLRLHLPCRWQRGTESGEPPGRPGACRLSEPCGHQDALGAAS